MTAPGVCQHGRTEAMCEACMHTAALADPQRAPATRAELYPFPDGGLVTAGFLHEDSEAAQAAAPAAPKKAPARNRAAP